jgi:hypothetical protein
MPSLHIPPTPNSQPVTTNTNLEAFLISDSTGSRFISNNEASPLDFVYGVDAKSEGQSMINETP